MWEALFAFHISIAQGFAELSRCSICKRTVRPALVVFLTPVVEGSPHVIQCAEPVRIQAFIAKSRLDVDQADLAFFSPAQHAPRCELRSIVRAHAFGHAAMLD